MFRVPVPSCALVPQFLTLALDDSPWIRLCFNPSLAGQDEGVVERHPQIGDDRVGARAVTVDRVSSGKGGGQNHATDVHY